MPSISSADLEHNGWAAAAVALTESGRVMVTENGKVQAVILTPSIYAQLLDAKHKADGVAELRARFDRQLACLNEPDASERLRGAISEPARLLGKVKVGDTF